MSIPVYQYKEMLNRQTNEILIGIENVLIELLASNKVLTKKLDEYLNLLVSSGLETTPNVTQGIVVGTTPIELARNDSAPSLTVNIANLDPAQPLWVGLESVNTNNGRVIQPRESVTEIVPIGKSIHGVTDLGTINVVVSQLHSLFGILIQSKGGV